MARNNNKMTKRHKMPKIEPAVMKMYVSTPLIPGNTDQTFTVDLSQCASILNRRFYRQGLSWAVAGIRAETTGFEGAIYTQKLPSTWVMGNSWNKGLRAWTQMNDNALEESEMESIVGRFNDFKIYANALHHNAGYAQNLLPICLDSAFPTPGTTTAQPGEWTPSKLVLPNLTPATATTATEVEIIAVGPNNPGVGASGLNAKSLVQGYALSRALPAITDPNVPAESSDTNENWYVALFSEGQQQDSEVIDNLERDGDQPPYPYENDGVFVDTMYPGGETQLDGLQIHDLSFITATTIGGGTAIPGGLFPCGLLQISAFSTTSASANIILEFTMVPGTHRGYLCEPMQEM